ncbi:MAG: 2-oxoacid:acceptor oxidoreductase subunit alpha [Elusimicrobiota bacterium]|nr:2-oxoacid:acceptor oxidoreductase subunit alpha [Elusimicrobiota bacterium]
MEHFVSNKKDKISHIDSSTIMFAGDSGDGIQLLGHQFADTTAIAGNDLSTLPDYPSEMRAPAGSLGGVSGFQMSFGDDNVMTPGSKPDVLVAMNPAALAVNLEKIEKGSIIILNEDTFTEHSLKKAGYTSNPLDDGTLSNYRIIKIPVNTLVEDTLKDSVLTRAQKLKCKNFYMLGIVCWMYGLSVKPTIEWMKTKFKKNLPLQHANIKAITAGRAYAESTQIFEARFQVKKSIVMPGKYRNVTGNEAAAYGLIAAAEMLNKKLYYGAYPITPATDILHVLAKYRSKNIRVFQAEDEIAAMASSVGASYAGAFAATGTSGPGFSLKSEALGLAVISELPLVVIDVQRGGPSTGLPTKTEQSDLLQALYGRHGESPLVVMAAASSEDCFYAIVEAAKIAVKYMTPVVVLTNAFIANGSEPFNVSKACKLKDFKFPKLPPKENFMSYKRDEKTLARPWAKAGLAGYEHIIGGLEKDVETGWINYKPENHVKMTKLRAEKIARVVKDTPPTKIYGDREGEVLVVGWGSTFGAITTAVNEARKMGLNVSSAHIRYLNPLPSDLGTIMRRFRKILIPEENLGQFRMIVKANYLIDPIGLNKTEGQPLTSEDILRKIKKLFAR